MFISKRRSLYARHIREIISFFHVTRFKYHVLIFFDVPLSMTLPILQRQTRRRSKMIKIQDLKHNISHNYEYALLRYVTSIKPRIHYVRKISFQRIHTLYLNCFARSYDIFLENNNNAIISLFSSIAL